MTVSVQQKLAWAKALAALKREISGKGVSVSERIRKAKQMAQIKRDLGGSGKGKTDDKLELPENGTPAQWGRIAGDWLKTNLQGKTITASNGVKIFFNRNLSIDHLAHDARRSELAAKSVQFVADVFQTGEYKGAERLNKMRQDDIVAFHAYEKWVQLDNGLRVYLRAKSAEFSDGRYEAYGDTVAYTQRILDMENRKRLPSNPTMDDAFGGIVSDTANNNALLTILQVIDADGKDVTESYAEDIHHSENSDNGTRKRYSDVLVRNGNKLLLVQRSHQDTFKAGHWWIAGGHIEDGETPEQAAKRELKEETGIVADNLLFLETAKLDKDAESSRFACAVHSENVKLQKNELADFAWVTIEEAKSYNLVGDYADLAALFDKVLNLAAAQKYPDLQPLDTDALKPVTFAENMTAKEVRGALQAYLKQFQGKTLQTSDGKIVRFSGKTTSHISNDAVRENKIIPQAISHLADVLKTGDFIGREDPYKERGDFAAFHVYRKWVEAGTTQVHMQVKVAELADGVLAADGIDLLVYTAKDYEADKEKEDKHKLSSFSGDSAIDGFRTSAGLPIRRATVQPLRPSRETNHTAVFDKAQAEIALVPLVVEILEIRQAEQQPSKPSDGMKASSLYAFDDTKTKSQRQRDNNAVFDLLDKADRGEITPENITPEQKAVLAKYSGSGGGLKSRDGKTGSAHEYYTPAPVAEAMWNAVKEMGFGGGKVLDPCGGSGVFGAFAPDNAVVQVVEMDATSAKVNELVNGSERYHVDVASFEERAQSIPDNSVDAIVTNVPFGDVSLRKHRNKDSKFQKENLQTYFVLRSLDKLRYGGLAAFIVPSSFLDGKGGKAANARVLTSQVAEFVGAYRLPNSVFGTAAADVATDVIFYRKYSKDVAEKIQELQAQNPEILTESNIMWQPYLDGKYFKLAENKKFIFGEEGEIESWRTDSDGNKKKVYAVLNNDSVANIAAAIKRFKGSRIDWDLLNAAETEPQTYEAGDMVYQNGQAYRFNGVTFDAVEHSENELESLANDVLSKMDTPLAAFENRVTAADALAAYRFLSKTGNQRVFPLWAGQLVQSVSMLDENKAEKQFRRVLVGLSVQYVMDNFGGQNQVEEHAELSLAMKERVPLDKKLAAFKKANEAIKLHYTAKTGYSAAWKGESVQTQQVLSQAKQIEKTQYLNGTLALPSEKVIELGINPMESDDWCVNADGSQAMKADDYFVGNLKAVLDKIDADIQTASDETVKAKLEKMRLEAVKRAPAVSVENMAFGLRNPIVGKQLVMQFVAEKIKAARSELNVRLVQQENGAYEIAIEGTSKTEQDKIFKRIGHYLANGTVTTGGIELTDHELKKLPNSEVLKQIRDEINKWNAQFDTWLKADKAFLADVRARAENPENIYFPQVEDTEPLTIDGAGKDIELHGYQNAFVRKMAREFGGINAFGVGLGKSFTGLAASQYALETGTKKKVCFIVPNAVLSNWNKESKRYFSEAEQANCLFIGADVDKNGDFVVNSKNYARDLNTVLENRHNKIFMTQQAFEKIRMREETVEGYLDDLSRLDKTFAESRNAAKSEKAEAKAANLAADLAGKNKLENAPFLEELGIDALVVDEAHHFKNAKQLARSAAVKGLPSGSTSNRALDMACKSWYIRGGNPRKDGVLLLTATPVTNSPLEIYSMLSLAVGEERVNKSMLGSVNGADDFIEAVCQIDTLQETDIQNEQRAYEVLTGIKNLDLVQNLIQGNADVKEAKDVGKSFKQVESEDFSDGIMLDKATKAALQRYKNAYRIARKAVKSSVGEATYGEDNQSIIDFESVVKEIGTIEKTAHPFSMINRMSNALLDLELNSGETRYAVANQDAAQEAVDKFNQGKGTFVTDEKPDDESLIVKTQNRKDEDGNVIAQYTVKMQAVLEDGIVVLNCNDFTAQLRLEKLLDDKGAGVSVNISPKVAALVENVKKEQAHIRMSNTDGTRPKFAKQIVFVESLAMHTKIKRILAKETGIPDSRITFISGKFNSDPDEIIEVQELYNAEDEGNKYSIIIANKKAEVGINLQKGTQAIHHMELNWTPDSITQRNGRGIRQGNTAEKVNVYYYEADGTFDSYKRTAINRKSNWIEQVMARSSENGTAEVGQGLTEEDYNEMIEFDAEGGAEAFKALQEKQAKRKKDQADQLALQAQNVNIDIVKQASKWLEDNPDAEAVIKAAVKQARDDNEALQEAVKKLNRAINKGTKTVEKNRQLVQLAEEKMQYWLKQLAGVTVGGGESQSARIAISFDEEVKDWSSDYYVVTGYNVSYIRYGDDISFADDNAIVSEWAQTREKQLAMREAAAKNAMTVTVDGAMPKTALEQMLKGFQPIKINGKYCEEGTILLPIETNPEYAAMAISKDYNYYFYREGRDSNSSMRFGRRGGNIDDEKWQIIQSSDADYPKALHVLAKVEENILKGVFPRHDEGDIKPSDIIPAVADYVSDAARNFVPLPKIEVDVLLPEPYFPRILYRVNPMFGIKFGNEAYEALKNRQAEILNFDRVSYDTIEMTEAGREVYGEIDTTEVYEWSKGLSWLLKHEVKAESFTGLRMVVGNSSLMLSDLVSPLYFPASYATLHSDMIERMKAAEGMDEAKQAYAEFVRNLISPIGGDKWSGIETDPAFEAEAKRLYQANNENAAKPLAVAVNGNTYALNKYEFKAGIGEGIRTFAKYLGLGDKLAWVNKYGQTGKGDVAFAGSVSFKGANTWLFAPELWEAIQEEAPAHLTDALGVKEIFE